MGMLCLCESDVCVKCKRLEEAGRRERRSMQKELACREAKQRKSREKKRKGRKKKEEKLEKKRGKRK